MPMNLAFLAAVFSGGSPGEASSGAAAYLR